MYPGPGVRFRRLREVLLQRSAAPRTCRPLADVRRRSQRSNVPRPDDRPELPPLLVGEETKTLAAQWQVFARFATGVAVAHRARCSSCCCTACSAGAVASVDCHRARRLRLPGPRWTRGAARSSRTPGFSCESATARARTSPRDAARGSGDTGIGSRVWLGVFYLIAAAIVYVAQGDRGRRRASPMRSKPRSTSSPTSSTPADSGTQLHRLRHHDHAAVRLQRGHLARPAPVRRHQADQALRAGRRRLGRPLGDVRGQARPKEEVRKIVSLWQSGEQFEQAGGKRERGVLFLGAPGTGKTMLAKAIASGFNCPFVSLPGSAFAQTFIGVDVVLVMWLSWRARRLARKWGGQCIVFIDEIDAVGMRSRALGGATRTRGPRASTTCPSTDHGRHQPDRRPDRRDRGMARTAVPRARARRRPLYPAPIQRIADRVREFVMPGTGGTSQGGLQQLLVVMDGVSSQRPARRILVNRVNTLLDATYVIPPRIRNVRCACARPSPNRSSSTSSGRATRRSRPRPGARCGRAAWAVTCISARRTRTTARTSSTCTSARSRTTPNSTADRRREELARITMGHSPAMIEQVCSLALTNAHHDGRRQFAWKDVLEAITVVEYGTGDADSRSSRPRRGPSRFTRRGTP